MPGNLDAAAREFGWKLNNGNVALLWRGGCIIRSRFLGDIRWVESGLAEA